MMRQSGKTERMLLAVIDYVNEKPGRPLVITNSQTYAMILATRFQRMLMGKGIPNVKTSRTSVNFDTRKGPRNVDFAGIQWAEKFISGRDGWVPFVDNSVYAAMSPEVSHQLSRIDERFGQWRSTF